MALPTVRQLQYFVRIAELRSYRCAAETFGMSQPPLTQQMFTLERRLGVQLFDRSTRRVELTAAGEALLPDARRTLSSLEATCAELTAVHRGTSGRIRIGLTDDFLSAVTLETVFEFLKSSPSVRVETEVGISTELLEKLMANELDLLLASPMAYKDSLIHQNELPSSEIVLLLPENHSLFGVKPVALEELADWPLIMMPESSASPFARQCILLLEKAAVVPNIIHTCASAILTAQFVAATGALAFATRGSISRLPSGVVLMPIASKYATLKHSVFYRAAVHSAALRRLLGELAKV